MEEEEEEARSGVEPSGIQEFHIRSEEKRGRLNVRVVLHNHITQSQAM
jgi:hypothetical protein